MQLQTHTIQDAITHLQAMPEPMQLEVFHYIDILNTRLSKTTKPDTAKTNKKRQAGTANGVAIFAEDFDEPLDDFKDYM